MALMTRDDYIDSLKSMKKRVFIMGQEVENLAGLEEKMQVARRLAGIEE